MNTNLKVWIALGGGAVATYAAGLGLLIGASFVMPPMNRVTEVRENALILEYAGTSPLEELLRSQKLELKYDIGGRVVATMDAHEAVASACSSGQYALNPVCERYSEIPTQMEVRRAAQAKHDWIKPTGIVLALAGLAGVSGALYYATSIFKTTRREAARQNSPA